MLAKEEHLCTFQPTTLTVSDAPPAPYHPFPATPQQWLTYVSAWPAVQLGPPPLMALTQPAPLAPVLVPPALVVPLVPPFQAPPVAPPQHFGYPPGSWGQMPNYYPAPAQPYLIGYPPGLWPPYQQYYTGHPGHGDEDSETAKPDKFTGQEPLKLRPFIVSCVMAFDSWPRKFVTDRQ